MIGKNKWGKTEALDRGDVGGKGKEHPVSISFRGQRCIPMCLSLLRYFSLSYCYFSPHVFTASSSGIFELAIKIGIL